MNLDTYFDLLDLLDDLQIKRVESKTPNKLLTPITRFNLNEKGVEDFNKLYLFLLSHDVKQMIMTHSHGISLKNTGVSYHLSRTATCIEIIICADGYARVQLRGGKELELAHKKEISGRQAFTKFKKMLEINGIDLNKYAIDNGKEIKEEIEKPYICLEDAIPGFIFKRAHHIDFHNSYPAGLCNTHPEFKDIITHMYDRRKENEIYKAILNYSIGFMQSIGGCDAKWAHLSRDAIKDNNDRIRDIAERLKAAGNHILSYNTDGIWYIGNIYHGEGEGSGLGQWENDHVNCQWRCKSAGAYEFIENNKYTPVVRGYTNLDKKKSRDQWSWGDIFKEEASPITFRFDESKGVIYGKEE